MQKIEDFFADLAAFGDENDYLSSSSIIISTVRTPESGNSTFIDIVRFFRVSFFNSLVIRALKSPAITSCETN